MTISNEDQEIEIKIRLSEDNFLRTKEMLKKVAKFKKNSHQLDEYFTPSHKNFLEPKFPFEWLSVRKRDDKTILNYKHYYPEDAETKTHCDEFEVEIKNLDEFKKIFSVLDFKKLVTVEKEREEYSYDDEFEIGLDTVKNLGNFIEIEAIKNLETVEKTREKLFEVAKNLGIDISKTEKVGYPYLMMKAKGLLKK